ncbi:cytochrome c3 family protein [Geomesophilobacter sediminis]|uniref:Cytochrome C n=1 Tax=Geomesophilobacter sediminis TaxID=2798584 RepID=A0A8J7SB86_9BACT|nr:hypothetical protein [Geomesophilobacter sediminis]MBJ6727930.1 hypothetical protein [Geomesophilobacter sediminis]
MRNHLSKLHYLLLVAFLLAMTGCGAHNLAGLGGNGGTGTPGAVNAKLVWGGDRAKTTAKSVKLTAPNGITSVQVTVTGTGIDGNPVPVVRGTVDTATNQGTIAGIYPGKVTLAVKAFTGTAVTYEGFAIGVTVNSGATTTLTSPIVMTFPTPKTQDNTCQQCHETTLDIGGQNLIADYKQSGHYTNTAFTSFAKYSTSGVLYTGCAGCHGPNHNDHNPAVSGRCASCHGVTTGDANHQIYLPRVGGDCTACHSTHNFALAKAGCVGCHSIPQNAGAGFVQDNNGVRAAATEFSKWSHHVTGVTLDNAHCAACHLEGTIDSFGNVTVDASKHMADSKTHLRNAHTDADMVWDPATPNHTTMDNFCMSCHSATGATSPVSLQIQAYINGNGVAANGKTASPTNPFGDTISNRYDKMQRPAVTNVDNQFDTTNNSHHGVKGARYTGRTRAAGARQIASPGTFAANSSATLKGARSTIYDAGNFNALYVPLGTDGTAATGLGDDSTLHCGDCHTVGQWSPGVTTDGKGNLNTVAIGAHGSNNEYLLRNYIGTDEKHTQNAFTVSANNTVTYTNPNGAFLVCYNCHAYSRYGSIYIGTGLDTGNGQQPHAGEYDQAGRCNGIGNTLPFGGYTTGKATDGTQFEVRIFGVPGANSPGATYGGIAAGNNGAGVSWYAGGEQGTDFGNIFGIQCLNCHNSGAANSYGGIHGSAKDTSWTNASGTTFTPAALLAAAGVTPTTKGYYIDGMGNATKVERFLPGLGDAQHVPGTLGGFTGTGATGFFNGSTASKGTFTTQAVSNDTNWEQKHWQQTASTQFNLATGVVSGTLTSAGGGCYTLGTSTNIKVNVTAGLKGPAVDGVAADTVPLVDTWGGCDDHTAAQGNGNHGFVKRIVRPVTY